MQTKKKEREEILGGFSEWYIQVLIGTHALITDKVIFHHKLGLVVTDEQHPVLVRQEQLFLQKE